ncbi:hypothetical protein [Methylobacterium oxalidis]|nr:hypothetical protein [Methylobacterium oxalidis]GJE34592.1 hypothetical protein LDDCCGHA_4804 [Methylobacterium oxalidis]
MDPSDDHDPSAVVAQAARSPTRRRLLTLLASLPAAAAGNPAMSVSAEATLYGSSSEPIIDLFLAFEALLAKHEAALWRCDRREAWLQSELDYPRVPLPTPAGSPIRYAADAETVDQHVPPGRRRYRLQQVLHHRQQAWERGARACGVTRAQEQEAALAEAVYTAAETLLGTPATTLTEIRFKLLVLLATQDPGEAFRDASPWRELHLILTDVSAQAALI